MNTPSDQSTIDPACCPLCGQANRCAMEIERETGTVQPSCWCSTVLFAPELLTRIPLEARARACICQSCATRESAA